MTPNEKIVILKQLLAVGCGVGILLLGAYMHYKYYSKSILRQFGASLAAIWALIWISKDDE